MKLRRVAIVPTLFVAVAVLGPHPAEARNPHCAGGIQYVVGGLRDKEKGNLEDYQRQFSKAVQQLEQCATEDTADAEALGYLGWAYAEVDSCGPAGQAFQLAIARLKAKGDLKKVEWATNNRDSYWANRFNDGIGKISDAQSSYPDYTKQPDNDADKSLREEAGKHYQEAIASLTRASLLRPNHPQTIRNLGSVYVFMGEFDKAASIYQTGLAVAPGDSTLLEGLKVARGNQASQFVVNKKYDEAARYFQELLKTDPKNPDLHSGLADAHFQLATSASKKASELAANPAKADSVALLKKMSTGEFRQAGESYSAAWSLKNDDCDLAFNAALAFQNAGDLPSSEGQWRRALQCKPGDPEAISSLASVLAEEKKFPESVKLLIDGLHSSPKNKTLHRQLGGVYNKMNESAKASEELMVFLAMQNGQAVSNADSSAKKSVAAGAAGGKALAKYGSPDEVWPWEANGEKYDTWFYWSKGLALHFKSGIQISSSDWTSGPSASPKK